MCVPSGATLPEAASKPQVSYGRHTLMAVLHVQCVQAYD
jgi:hypothetical protein